jgi:hypothetical protein
VFYERQYTQPPTLVARESIDCLSTCITNFNKEYAAFYHGMFTLCEGCYGAYMCIPDQVTITGSGGMSLYTRVYAIGCAWAPAAVPHHRQVMSAPAPEAAVLAKLIQRMEAPEWAG